MEVRAERDLIIAALVAVGLHGLLALTDLPSPSFSARFGVGENKVIAISMVSAYRETEIKPSLVKKEKEPVVREKRQVEKTKEEKRKARVDKEKITETPPVTRRDVAAERDCVLPAPKGIEKIFPVPSLEPDPTVHPDNKEVVSVLPRYRETPQPPYPPLARRRGYEGTTLLSLYILENGTVGEVVVKKTSGHSVLDRAAVKAVRKWLFEPGTRMGAAIPLWVDVPIRFVVTGKS